MSQAIFEALSSIHRRRILAYLAEASMTASEIAGRFEMSKPAHPAEALCSFTKV